MNNSSKIIIGGIIIIIFLPIGYILGPLGFDYYMKTPSRTELNQLTQLIKESEQIIVYEHSHQDDFENKEPSPRITYKKITLTSDQKKYFLSLISEIPPSTYGVHSLCIFVPHHTIDFYKNNNKTSFIRICFTCGDIQWNHKQALDSPGTIEAFQEIIKSIGMEPERDWKKLVKAHTLPVK